MSSKHTDKEYIEKLSFGKQTIQLEIPKFTDVLIVTTVSQATNGTTSVSTYTYSSGEIKNLIQEGDK